MMPYALPPAESKLPFSRMLKGVRRGNADFATAIAEHLKVNECLLAESARALLYLLFVYLRKRKGSVRDEVLIPGYTCYSVAAAVVKAGLKVALYDVDPATLQPDLQDVRRKISPRTLAVVGQHLLGARSCISGLAAIAREHGVFAIVDSAQSLDEAGEGLGMVADFTLFSFGRGKPLPLGCGGAIIAKDSAELARVFQSVSVDRHSRVNFLLPFIVQIFSNPRLYWFVEKLPLGLGCTVYDPGFFVAGMPSFYQRLGCAVFEELAHLNRHRSLIGGTYREYFQGQGFVNTGDDPPWIRYPLLVQDQDSVKKLARYGVRQLYPLALCDLPALKKNLTEPASLTPGAREIAEHLITLPTHLSVSQGTAGMISQEVERRFKNIQVVRRWCQ